MSKSATPLGRTFVGFPGPDRDAATGLVEHLRGFGLDVTWEDDVHRGRRFTETLPDAMAACTSFVFLVTGNSAEAKFQHDEVNIAVEREKSAGATIHVVTDLKQERMFGLRTLPPVPWRDDAARAAFLIAADLMGWKDGARDQPPRVPEPSDSRRFEGLRIAATLALAVERDRVPREVVTEVLEREPLTMRFARYAATEELCVVLRAALFKLIDRADGEWRDALSNLAMDLIRRAGRVASETAQWIRHHGTRAGSPDTEAPPALIVRVEGLASDRTFFLAQAELRTGGAAPLWQAPPAGLVTRRGARDLADLLRHVEERKLKPHGIRLDDLVLLVEVDAAAVGAGFHRWPGCDEGLDLARQLRAVATWPCTVRDGGETRARPAGRDVARVVVTRPLDAPAPSVRLRGPVTAHDLNGVLGARVAVFADAPAWRNDCCVPVSGHAGRLLTVLLEEHADQLVDELFGSAPGLSVAELFGGIRRAWLTGREAHVVWTDPRYTPTWTLSFHRGDPLFDSL